MLWYHTIITLSNQDADEIVRIEGWLLVISDCNIEDQCLILIMIRCMFANQSDRIVLKQIEYHC